MCELIILLTQVPEIITGSIGLIKIIWSKTFTITVAFIGSCVPANRKCAAYLPEPVTEQQVVIDIPPIPLIAARCFSCNSCIIYFRIGSTCLKRIVVSRGALLIADRRYHQYGIHTVNRIFKA